MLILPFQMATTMKTTPRHGSLLIALALCLAVAGFLALMVILELRQMHVVIGVLLCIAVAGLAVGLACLIWRARREEIRLAKLSQLDGLTRLAHRDAFIDRLTNLTTQTESAESGFTVMFIDIRRFSEINRLYGLEAADHVLRIIADRLKSLSKIAGWLARIGGDQFAVVFEGLGSEAAAIARAGGMLERIRLPIAWQDNQLRVSANIGLAIAPRHGRDRNALMKRADLALQHAKDLGANQIAVFTMASGQHYEARLALERLVMDAADDKGFSLHYQPVIDMKTSRIAGFEALLRLADPEGRHVSPADFVPILEHLGRIDDVGRWVIERACAFARHWPDGVKVAVNLSPLQFGSGNLPDDVAEILERTGCPAHRLELEVTENLVLDRSHHVKDQLDNLQHMGIAIVLDDFGTGYSSLSYLCQFAFDKIKIDQGFIRGAGQSQRALGILRTIAALARRFDIEVTAEGVETLKHAELVRRLKCRFAQGYLFSRPVPETEVADLILRDYASEIASQAPNLPRQRPHLRIVGK